MREVSARLRGGGRKATAFVGTTDTDLRRATWFAPRFVVEVNFRGIGRQALLRQPSLKAVRWDKDIGDLADSDRDSTSTRVTDMAEASSKRSTSRTGGAKVRTGAAKVAAKQATKKPANASRGAKRGKDASDLPTLSSPEKIVFPDAGITKQEVWDYYIAVMDHLLPEIVGRPLSVIRCPGGIGQACFFQKHLTAGLERVSTVRLKEESGRNAHYLVVEDEAGLMELVQFNTLEFHPWGAHAADPDVADRVVFDLDPGEGVPFSEVKKAAADIRKLLEQLELVSFLRASGGKGLHVVVPLNPGCDWDLTKRFARGFAETLAQSQPDRFLATATKSKRSKRIFIDYLRNGRGATAVASYSLRGRPGAPVAMPLAWRELSKLPAASAFTIKDVPARLRRRRKDPWEDIDRIRQNLARWAKDA